MTHIQDEYQLLGAILVRAEMMELVASEVETVINRFHMF